MVHFTTYYCRLPSGRIPVREFIDLLPIATYHKFIFKKELLEAFGPRLPMPHAKHVGNGLYELRFKGHSGAIRAFYFFAEKRSIIFVHAFKKTTSKIPAKELGTAYKRMGLHKKVRC